VGGGVTLYKVTRDLDEFAKEFGKASVEQIAVNCGIDFDESKYVGDVGYNARTGQYSNLLEDGVIEPFDVFKYSVSNALSIAIAILTSGYTIVNKVTKE
jgi:chaperonin GroEL (HSP60 family)